MLIRLLFTQTVVQKLVEDQGIFPIKSSQHSDNNITVMFNIIRRPGGLVGGSMPDRVNQISILAAKNLKLAAFMFKTME